MQCLRSAVLRQNAAFMLHSTRRPAVFAMPSVLSARQLPVHRSVSTMYDWESIKTKPERTMRRASVLTLLLLMPIISFGLATWQIYRLEWKTNLIAEYENRLLLPPLVLPPKLDSEALNKLQYRRVLTKGKFRYDQEFLVGPRLYEGENGYAVITPFEREDGSTILINRGWIRKDMADQSKRSKAAMPEGAVFVEGLIKSPAKPNYFTPKNVPEKNEFYFVDVEEFAKMTNAEPVIIEELVTQYLDSDAFVSWETLSNEGIPIGRLPKHDLRNTHSQYIATWFGVFVATSVMCVMMLRSPKSSKARKVQHARKYYS